ncbi:hypothetical protein [Nocardia sp. NBC_00511]|uniref:hypothetical protein n=1 Tax=Nocardia sp. NBC_00511 TaxID=2903591 RepID=UPI0030DF9AB3
MILYGWVRWYSGRCGSKHGIIEGKSAKQIGIEMDTAVIFALACLIYWYGLL